MTVRWRWGLPVGLRSVWVVVAGVACSPSKEEDVEPDWLPLDSDAVGNEPPEVEVPIVGPPYACDEVETGVACLETPDGEKWGVGAAIAVPDLEGGVGAVAVFSEMSCVEMESWTSYPLEGTFEEFCARIDDFGASSMEFAANFIVLDAETVLVSKPDLGLYSDGRLKIGAVQGYTFVDCEQFYSLTPDGSAYEADFGGTDEGTMTVEESYQDHAVVAWETERGEGRLLARYCGPS